MGFYCNLPAKITSIIAALIGVAAIILWIVAGVRGNQATDLKFVAENTKSYTHTVSGTEYSSLIFYLPGNPSDSKCEDNNLAITEPAGAAVAALSGDASSITKTCFVEQDDSLKKHKPELQHWSIYYYPTLSSGSGTNSMSRPVDGIYTFSSSTPFYVIDPAAYIAGAVVGLLGAIGLFAIAVITSCVTVCVFSLAGCIACCASPPQQQHGAAVVGSPVMAYGKPNA